MNKQKIYLNDEGLLVIKSKQGLIKYEPADISHLTCQSYLTSIFVPGKPTVSVPQMLKRFEAVLKDFGFIHANRYTLVNIQHVVQLRNGKERKALLTNNITVDISRRRYKFFRESFEFPQK